MDISACIAELLYEQTSVGLPGLGAITCRYKPAAIDHVQGKLSPPAKELTFDPNLVLDDGLLAQTVARRFNISLSDAAAAVSDFVKQIQATLDRREMFTIPGVGRLYKDFEQNLQFLSEEVNYNPDTHGLPTLQYYPTLRHPRPDKPAETPVIAPQSDPISATLAGWFQRNLLWITLATVLIISGSIYGLKFAPKANKGIAETEDVPSEFLNVKPGQTEPPAENTAPIDDDDEPVQNDTEAPTLPPDQKVCTIRVGRFGNADNVRRLVRQAQELGMNPYTKKVGSLTEMGITFPYSEEREIKEMLAAARKSLAKDAVVESK
jgi:hypothetical protein